MNSERISWRVSDGRTVAPAAPKRPTGDPPEREDEQSGRRRLWMLAVGCLALLAVVLFVNSLLGCMDCGDWDVELTAEYDDPVVSEGETVTVAVYDENGEPVEDALVIVSGNTLTVDGPYGAETANAPGDDHEVTFAVGGADADVRPDWNSNQEVGTLEIELRGTGDGGYVDDEPNPTLDVVRA